jgi:hypothetical protein
LSNPLQVKPTKLRWRWGLLAAAAVTLLSLVPQIDLWLARGADFQGEYAYIDTDEVAYSAYVNALVDGRPRRNDPYTGRDDREGAPQPESLFSIQFIPAYMVALPARILGLQTSSTFIALIALAAFASSLMIFRLVWEVTGREHLAAVAVLFVLCLGTLAAAQGAVRPLFGAFPAYDNLPFLRRYLPALPFTFYFLFCLFVWRALNKAERKLPWRSVFAAGVCFVLLVFSYFYLWTAALGWLACLVILWLIVRPAGWERTLLSFSVIGAFALLALVPYFILLSNRSQTMDKVQALTASRAPDLFRSPELIGFACLIALAMGARRGLVKWKETPTLFAASFALMPALVFNQQILTGRSLQPIHYEQFIANYVSLVGLVLTIALLWSGRRAATNASREKWSIALACVALLSFGWGVYEVRSPGEIYLEHNRLRDQAMPAIRRLKELAGDVHPSSNTDPMTLTSAYPIVFSTDDFLSESLPTHTPLGVLWARHMYVFSGVSWEENKERFYNQLYFIGIDRERFSTLIRDDFQFLLTLFGWERANHNLTVNPQPVTDEEINQEISNYTNYLSAFDRKHAARPLISYVVTPESSQPDFSNLDRWYERDAGERAGKYIIYRVKLRQ